MKVFLSYAHTDEAIARRVADILHQAGLEVWEATREIMPGDNWAAKVDKALRDSQAMVVLLTPRTMRLNWVRSEIEYALGEVRFCDRLIPVVVGDPELKYVRSMNFTMGDGTEVVDVLFHGAYQAGEPEIVAPDEVADVRWMTAKEILAHERTPPWLKGDMKDIDPTMSAGELPLLAFSLHIEIELP